MSIANSNFSFLANSYLIYSMQTIAETRRQRLIMLMKQHGGATKLNEAIGRTPTDGQLNLYKNRNLRPNGKPHQMGDNIAREIEQALKLPEGWMDTPPTYAEQLGEEDPQAKVMMVMEQMSPEMQRLFAQLGDTMVKQPVFSPPIQISNGSAVAPAKGKDLSDSSTKTKGQGNGRPSLS
jgi:hypothetical protein